MADRPRTEVYLSIGVANAIAMTLPPFVKSIINGPMPEEVISFSNSRQT